ncbi:M48 family metallopeptidase [Thermaerobacillus caldiproteolyticus]|uniref:Zn-dependent protease with chaperone function n=1 Tax=Thermaerobacillus caldiproteolyticus TaxID=247480 RepID=A0A7W0BXS4_9BACL|nr:M48 family metallopeptidase [Anoxybacillus caldiproteolyticus]MBA2874836.1 Zn-dependent protease with chaperone function [Anoxybacillus caldiproteolyticus]QPA31591.1 M48 family metallopeptidase [Anoxybacillus caldiproteolyticus]
MKKIIGWAVAIYVLYCVGMAWYLFSFADTSIPPEWKGTSADPATFLTPREQLLSEQYSQLKNFLFFVSVPYDWLVYFGVLGLGVSKVLQTCATRATKLFVLQVALYVFWLSLIVMALTLPLDFVSYRISRAYDISTQPVSSWLRDELIDFFVNYVLTFFIVTVLYGLIRRFEKRWWLYAWGLSVPFTIFFMFIQPVVIDPLYNDFYPLKDKALEAKILTLAQEAHIPAKHVFEVNMSEKTNALNAYVTGIGSHSRIVLWDTTLKRLQEDEVLFIMAHEMGHYVMKHVYWGVAGYIVLTFFGLLVANWLMKWVIARWGAHLRIKKMRDIASLPLFLLIISLLNFSVSPLVNAVSRYEEHAADKYAIELTGDTEAAVSSFQKLTKAGLSQVNPPYIVKLFRYTHPTILERIVFLQHVQSSKSQ